MICLLLPQYAHESKLGHTPKYSNNFSSRILVITVGFNPSSIFINDSFNKLVELLGGKNNIVSTETNMSRFKVVLKDVTKADKDGIQKLGAKGIVEIDNQLKIILGPDSKQLKKYIDEIK